MLPKIAYQQISCEFFQFANLKHYYGFDTNKIAYQKVRCELFQYATLKHCYGFDSNNTNGFAIDWINIINKILMQYSDTLFITLNTIAHQQLSLLPLVIKTTIINSSIVILKSQQLNKHCSCDKNRYYICFFFEAHDQD